MDASYKLDQLEALLLALTGPSGTEGLSDTHVTSMLALGVELTQQIRNLF